MTFADPKDYDLIGNEGDKLSLVGLNELAPGKVKQRRRWNYMEFHMF